MSKTKIKIYYSKVDGAYLTRVGMEEDLNFLLKRGITEVQYKEMMNNQKGVCFTCGETNGKKKLVVDHCHNTSKIRGLLCDSCNRSIGLLRENVNTLNNIINYLSIS